MALRSVKHFLKTYFTFDRRQRRSAVVLLCILLVIFGVQALIRFTGTGRTPARFRDFRNDILAYERQWKLDSEKAVAAHVPARPARTASLMPPPAPVKAVAFDPNTAPDSVWRGWGVAPFLVRRIRHYLAAGGRFRRKEDVLRIYGFPQTVYDRMQDFLTIPPSRAARPRKDTARATFDLNRVTAQQLRSIRGIGEVRSKAIISYRSRLGGYLRKSQLLELYVIDSALYDSIRGRFTLSGGPLQHVNVNAEDLGENRHPYLTRRMARLITAYREMHGRFDSTRELYRIEGIPEAALKRIFPYLAVE